MKLILDTADVNEIKKLNELLNVSGVTTNPTIITKSGKKPEVVINEIADILDESQMFFVQVLAETADEMVEEAKEIMKIRPKNMYAKIPVTHEGLKAIKKCKELGIPTLATAIYSANQAFMAAQNGANYLAPYVNRMCNYGNGVEEVIDLIEMLKVQNSETGIVAASFKNTDQVHQLIKAGIQSVTIPVDVAYNMIDHPATTIAVAEFGVNWQKAYGRSTLFEK